MSRPKLIVSAMILLLLFAGGYRLLRVFGGTSQGVVHTPVTTVAATKTTQRTQYDGHYASFSYLASFEQKPVQPAVYPVLENLTYTKPQFGNWFLSIQIQRLPSSTLSDNGTYNLRLSRPAQYPKQTRTIAGRAVTEFSDTSSGTFSKTDYFQSGSLSASVSLSGGTPEQQTAMQTELDAIINSWQWYD